MDTSNTASSSSNQNPHLNPNDNSSPEAIVGILGNLMKSQTGEAMSPERMSQLLLANMHNLVKQGKLNQNQILQLKQFADKQLTTAPQQQSGNATASSSNTKPIAATAIQGQQTPHSAFKAGAGNENGTPGPTIGAANPADFYPPITQTLDIKNPGPVQWAQTRPTLSGGIVGGRMSGTPSQVARNPDDSTALTLDDNRSRPKNTPGDQSMRRTIQDLVASVDPNVKIEPEVEDLLLSIADEFIDSVTNFSCRLAKHRGGDTLDVRDLQLHLERNHNIRIPGFASDETRLSLSQSSVAPIPSAAAKKNAQGTHMTLRSQRLAQVQQAKREAKLM